MTELPDPQQFGDYGEWPGRAVLNTSGERLGKVREIYLDDATDRPEWVLVDRDEGEPRFIPLADARIEGETIHVTATAETVEAAPSLATTKQLTQDQERELYRHYGVPLDEDASDSLLPATDDAATDDAATGPAAEAPAEGAVDTPVATDTDPAADTPAAATTGPADTPVAADTGPAAPGPAPATVPEPPVATGPTATPVPEPVATGPTPTGDPPPAASEIAPDEPSELPPPGETSAPEDRGPMVPPRPEPVAPPRAEARPSGPLATLRSKPFPVLAGIAAGLAAAIAIVVRRRS